MRVSFMPQMVASMASARLWASAVLAGVRGPCGTKAAKHPASSPPAFIFGRSTWRAVGPNGSGEVGHGMSMWLSSVRIARCSARESIIAGP